MQGLSNTTGQMIGDLEHLSQSIRDVLTTPIGSRVHRRDYGSRLFELTDSPANDFGRLQLFAATADALRRWEPRMTLTAVNLVDLEDGQITLELSGTVNEENTQLLIPIGGVA